MEWALRVRVARLSGDTRKTNNSETTGEWTGEQQAQEKESLRSTRLVNKTIGGDKMEVESKSETSNVSTPA